MLYLICIIIDRGRSKPSEINVIAREVNMREGNRSNRGGGGGFGRRSFGSGGRGSDSRGGGFNRSFGPREMHKATCDECKQECEVPFKPTPGKPVYCRDCYSKHKKF